MNTTPNQLNPQPVEPKKKGSGCFFYGCLTLVVLTVLLALASYYFFRSFSTRMITEYTDDHPIALPGTNITAEAAGATRARVEAFMKAVENNTAKAPLALSGDDVNALIRAYPETEKLKDAVFVEIKDNRVTGLVSLPLAQWGFPGRFANATAEFRVSQEEGLLAVHALSASVKGQPIPESTMLALRQENLAKKVFDKPQAAEALMKIERIEVKEGKVIITPKTAAANGVPSVLPPAVPPPVAQPNTSPSSTDN